MSLSEASSTSKDPPWWAHWLLAALIVAILYGQALGFGFDPHLPTEMADTTEIDKQNAIAAQAIEHSQAALVANRSQKTSFPAPLRQKIRVLPEGLSLEKYGSNPKAQIQLGSFCFSAGQPLVTLVSRTLEPLRGLRQALKAWPLVLEQRPDAQLLLVGDPNPPGYGIEAPIAANHLEDALAASTAPAEEPRP